MGSEMCIRDSFKGVKVSDINENVDDPEGTIRTNLTRMTKNNLLVTVERGVYDIKVEYDRDQRVFGHM